MPRLHSALLPLRQSSAFLSRNPISRNRPSRSFASRDLHRSSTPLGIFSRCFAVHAQLKAPLAEEYIAAKAEESSAMDIRKKDFLKQLPRVKKDIENCDFVAIDLEFSGLVSSQRNLPNGADTLQDWYRKTSANIKDLSILQYGICCFTREEGTSRFQAKPYNFYIYPSEVDLVRPPIRRRFVFESGAFSFLDKNKFDFSAWVRCGIPYLSVAEERRVRDYVFRLQRREAAAKGNGEGAGAPGELDSASPEVSQEEVLRMLAEGREKSDQEIAQMQERDRDFLRRVLERVEKARKEIEEGTFATGEEAGVRGGVEGGVAEVGKVSDSSGPSPPPPHQDDGELARGSQTGADQTPAPTSPTADPHIVLDACNSWLRRLVYNHLGLRYLDVVVSKEEADNVGLPERVRRLRVTFLRSAAAAAEVRDARLKEQLRRKEEAVQELVGFRAVVDAVSAAGVPVVVHNGALDLFHTLDKFRALPDDRHDFATELHALFPRLVDTKYLLSAATAFAQDGVMPSTALEDALQTLERLARGAQDKEGEESRTSSSCSSSSPSSASSSSSSSHASSTTSSVSVVSSTAATSPTPSTATTMTTSTSSQALANSAVPFSTLTPPAELPSASREMREVSFALAEGFDRYANEKVPHEAAFDAYMTGMTFVRAALTAGYSLEDIIQIKQLHQHRLVFENMRWVSAGERGVHDVLVGEGLRGDDVAGQRSKAERQSERETENEDVHENGSKNKDKDEIENENKNEKETENEDTLAGSEQPSVAAPSESLLDFVNRVFLMRLDVPLRLPGPNPELQRENLLQVFNFAKETQTSDIVTAFAYFVPAEARQRRWIIWVDDTSLFLRLRDAEMAEQVLRQVQETQHSGQLPVTPAITVYDGAPAAQPNEGSPAGVEVSTQAQAGVEQVLEQDMKEKKEEEEEKERKRQQAALKLLCSLQLRTFADAQKERLADREDGAAPAEGAGASQGTAAGAVEGLSSPAAKRLKVS